MKRLDNDSEPLKRRSIRCEINSKQLDDKVVIGLFILLVVFFFYRVTFLGQVLMPLDITYTAEPWRSELPNQIPRPIWNPVISDAVWQFYPMASYANEAWSKDLPLWDPFVLSGMPALAKGEMFSDPIFNLLAIFIPFDHAISWGAIIHILIALIATYLLLREMKVGQTGAFVAAMAFGLNGYLIGWLELPPVTGSMVWLPVVYLGIERAYRRKHCAWIVLGAAGFTMQILSGSILWPYYAGVTLMLLAIYRSLSHWWSVEHSLASFTPLLITILVLGLGTALAAFQLLPTLELFLQTQRGEPLGANSGLNWPNLLRLVVPELTGNPLHGDQYLGPFNHAETNIYFGILPLIFAVVSRYSRRQRYVSGYFFLGLCALLAVYWVPVIRKIISMLYYPVFYSAFPGRIFYITAFTWAISAGFGVDWLIRQRPTHFLKACAFVTTFVLLAVGGLTIYAVTYGQPVTQLDFPEDVVLLFTRYISIKGLLNGLVWLSVATAVIWLLNITTINSRWMASIIVITVGADLIFAGIDHNPAFPSEQAFPVTPGIEFLQSQVLAEQQPVRIAPVNTGLIMLGMTPELYRLPAVTGYTSWVLQRYSEYLDLTGDRASASINHAYLNDCCHPLINALNAKYIYTSQNTTLSSVSGDLSLIAELANAEIATGIDQAPGQLLWTINSIKHPVLYAHPPTEITYTISISQPATFLASIAMDPASWNTKSDGVMFELYVSEPSGDSPRQRLFSRYVDPRNQEEDRGWIDVSVDLPAPAENELVLTLVTDPGPTGDLTADWAGWGDVRISGIGQKSLALLYDGPNKIYVNDAALPRAWVVHRVTAVPRGNLDEVKKLMSVSSFDPSIEAVIESDILSSHLVMESPVGKSKEKAEIIDYDTRHMIVHTETTQEGLLVLSEIYYPGWRVKVDGIHREILATNLALRGVFLDAGEHTIEFTYNPATFFIGIGISIITFFGLLAYSVFRKRLSHRFVT